MSTDHFHDWYFQNASEEFPADPYKMDHTVTEVDLTHMVPERTLKETVSNALTEAVELLEDHIAVKYVTDRLAEGDGDLARSVARLKEAIFWLDQSGLR